MVVKSGVFFCRWYCVLLKLRSSYSANNFFIYYSKCIYNWKAAFILLDKLIYTQTISGPVRAKWFFFFLHLIQCACIWMKYILLSCFLLMVLHTDRLLRPCETPTSTLWSTSFKHSLAFYISSFFPQGVWEDETLMTPARTAGLIRDLFFFALLYFTLH